MTREELVKKLARLLEDCDTYENASLNAIEEVEKWINEKTPPNMILCEIVTSHANKTLPPGAYIPYKQTSGTRMQGIKVAGRADKNVMYLKLPFELPVPPKPPSMKSRIDKLLQECDQRNPCNPPGDLLKNAVTILKELAAKTNTDFDEGEEESSEDN